MSTAETDYLFKVVLIGDPAVGKTNLLLHLADDRFEENYTHTIGVDFKFRVIRLDGKTIKLQLWDTAGQDCFRSIARSFYRGAHGIIVVYDVTRQTSFQSVDKWLQEVEMHNAGCRIPRLLVGNKCDLTDKAVDYGTAKAYADRMGMPFVETSARQSTNVEQAFFYLAAEMKQQEASSRAAIEVEGRYSYNNDPPIAITSTRPCAVGSSSRHRNCC